MSKTWVTVRLDKSQVARAKRALRTQTVTETIEQALALVTEKAAHDAVIRRYSGVGGPQSFASSSSCSRKQSD